MIYSWWLTLRELISYNEDNKNNEIIDLEHLVKDKLKNTVQHGVFKGMKYNVESIMSVKYPKIIGSYEMELTPYLWKLMRNKYKQMINIGCAEGYYSVGWAMKNKDTMVFAVDPLSKSKNFLSTLASNNGIKQQIRFFRWVSARRLNKWIKGRTLIIMDCVGAEVGLLNPLICNNLYLADILVEVHEFVEEGIGKKIEQRFSQTHSVRYIPQINRVSDNFDILKNMDEHIAQQLMDEKRSSNIHWLYIESNQMHQKNE